MVRNANIFLCIQKEILYMLLCYQIIVQNKYSRKRIYSYLGQNDTFTYIKFILNSDMQSWVETSCIGALARVWQAVTDATLEVTVLRPVGPDRTTGSCLCTQDRRGQPAPTGPCGTSQGSEWSQTWRHGLISHTQLCIRDMSCPEDEACYCKQCHFTLLTPHGFRLREFNGAVIWCL